MRYPRSLCFVLLIFSVLPIHAADAHRLREQGEEVRVARSSLTVIPEIDWNRLDGRRGRNTERWTLDGPQLNEVTFFGGIEDGEALFKSRGRNASPLPVFRESFLLLDVPDLLDSTYRISRGVRSFELLQMEPISFLGAEGVRFEYSLVASDGLVRSGEAFAAILDNKLYLTSYEAPELHYFERNREDFRALVGSMKVR